MGTDTRQLIKDAAFKVFSRKGFAAASTRDIATEAGVNHALINYYYDSKIKLFHEVMVGDIAGHIMELIPILNDPETTWKEKINNIIDIYSEVMVKQPHAVRFVLNELSKQGSDDNIVTDASVGKLLSNSVLEKQILATGLPKEEIPHLYITLISLLMGPYITLPFSKSLCALDNAGYYSLLEKRKKMILEIIEKYYGI